MQASEVAIVNLLKQRALSRLVTALQTTISDPTKAFEVREGRLQDDPTPGVSVMIYGNDPDNPGTWEHSVVTLGADPGLEVRKIVYDLGQSEMWFRRFSVQLKMFWPTEIEDRAEAYGMGEVVLARAQTALSGMLLPDGAETESVADSFGESALETYVMRIEHLIGGGPGQFISTGRMFFQVLTGR